MGVDRLIDGLAAIPAGGASAAMDARLALRRSWLLEPGRLGLEYAHPCGGVLGAQWCEEPGRLADLADAGPGSGPGSRILSTPLGDVLVHHGGADRRLPGLAELVSRPGSTLLGHRPERRGVVRVRVQGEVRYAKVVRPERTRAVLEAGRAAAAIGGSAFATPQPLGAETATGVVWWSAVDGRPLIELLGQPREAIEGWSRAGTALAALHRDTAPAAVGKHDGLDEVAVLGDWRGRLAWLDPVLARHLEGLSREVEAGLRQCGSEPVLLHRDFHDKQVLLGDDGAVALIDFDTLARGEAALDLANALVHLELRSLQGLCTGEVRDRAGAAFLEAYGPGAATRARIPVFADATRLRLACVYSFRPGTRAVVEGLLARVGQEPPG